VTDERGGGDLGEPPFNMGPLICFARVGVVLGEIAGVAGEHAIAPDILPPLRERDEMVDAGSDFAIPFYSGQTNVAVGASSTPIHVAALVVQIGRGHRLLQESLHPGFPFSIHQLGIQNDAARGEACPLSLQVRIHDTQCVAESWRGHDYPRR
jgi:hypothetical protein